MERIKELQNQEVASGGLQVERYFTIPGVDPFDQVDWERRTARIVGSDGTAVFEQPDVEFPKFWSQRATDIVAQKYFRGKLGSPERERSVRQMIGRVADTITRWGIGDGYFASPDDAATFRAELTHLLLHQMAAFNSPVWFNVGFEEKPQCSACQPYHARVNTIYGPMPIGEIVEKNLVGLPVYDKDGITQVMGVKANGIKPVYRITLNDGRSIEATGDHLVCAHQERRIKQVEWRRVDELQVGMYMQVYPRQATTFTASSEATDVSEAALAGWLQADGFAGQYEEGTNRSLTIEFMTVTEEEHAWVMEHLDQVFPNVPRKVSEVEVQDPSLQCRRIRLYGEHLRPFVEKYQLLNRRADIRVPEPIWRAGNDAVRAYLRSVFQGDGYAAVHGPSAHIAFSVISKSWAEELQVLLGRLGVYARLRQKRENRPDRYDQWELDVSIGSQRARFAEAVGFVSEHKQAKLEQSLSSHGKQCPDVRYQNIVAIEPVGEMEVYDIQTRSGCYLTNNVLVHNCFILSIEDNMESILEWYRNEGMIFRGGSGSGINLSRLRSSNEQLSKGGKASGPVSFMRGADAIAGTIKSGGKCFKKGTLVATPDGWQPIETLHIGDLVLTHRGPRAVADFMPNGLKQCYKVRTREGYEVEVTRGHKFAYWKAQEGCFDVKPIEDFKPDEALYILLEPSEGGTPIPLVQPESNDPPQATTTVEMKFPTELSEELAYVLGLAYGDAELRTEYPYRLRVAFCKDQAGQASAERFREYCVFLFGEEPLLLGDEKGHQQIGFTRKRLIEFLIANGLAKGKAEALGFPGILFQARPEVRAAFVAGVIDADGSYQRRGGWYIASIDRAFLVELQRLLLTLGIPSKIKLNREQKGSWQPLHRLHIAGHTFVEQLVERIAPYSAKARFHYEPSGGADKGWGYRPSLYVPLTSGAERRGGYTLVNRTVGTNETTGYGALNSLIAHPDIAVADYAEELSHCVQVTLESVEPTEVAETYDIEVEDVHLLSANGLYASNTRRAAKMCVLNVDHPDVLEFIWCKAKEERKAYALGEAGYDMSSLDSDAWISIQYQNANNSVRVTDEFMRAVVEDKDWHLRTVTTGEIVATYKARDILRQIAEAAWECGDPGLQYDTTTNDWHTCPNSGRINASNPCFTGDARVYTDKGMIQFRDLLHRVEAGETFRVFTDNRTGTNRDESVILSSPMQFMVTGVNDVYRLVFSNGMEVKATANHRFFTLNRGMVPAKDLTPDDQVAILNQALEFEAASEEMAFNTDAIFVSGWGGRNTKHCKPVDLPSSWSEPLAEYVGYLIGDGSMHQARGPHRRFGSAAVVFGNAGEAEEIIPRFELLFSEMNVSTLQEVVMPNGTVQVRVNRNPVVRMLGQLGVTEKRAHEKVVPESIFQAPSRIIRAFLRGLFTANGCVYNGEKYRYVGLGSPSKELLIAVQQLLASLGILSRIYGTKKPQPAFTYTRQDGTVATYQGRQTYDLRISGPCIRRFAEQIGFLLKRKTEVLSHLIANHNFYSPHHYTQLISMEYAGKEVTYNLTEPINHSYIVNGLIVANCSEYMHLDNSACNLGSLNLMKFYDTTTGEFNTEAFRHAVDITILAQEIIVGNSSYPTERITMNAKAYRQLGLGYANLGALLMARGVPYDSDEGRAYAATLTALLTGEAYAMSARIAEKIGPFAGYLINREPMLNVIRKHRDSLNHVDRQLVPEDVFQAAQQAWDEALARGDAYGYRNAQASVLAPTGTISFMLDCDTTGIEPDIALVKYKKLVGGGEIKMINHTVPVALRRLEYSENEIAEIMAYIDERGTIEGAPHLKLEHLPVFDCAFRAANGTRSIHHMGHIRMMGAVQPFISGAISKTCNLPHDVTPDDIAEVYIEGWKQGLKALAIYRDGSKRVQPLSTGKDKSAKDKTAKAPSVVAEEAEPLPAKVAEPVRRRLPDTRRAITHHFTIRSQDGSTHDGYITVGMYEDGSPGEIFVTVAKEGSTISGLMDAFATAISIALQYGVPLEALVKKFSHMRFEPSGVTTNPEVRVATSLVDYVFRWLASQFLDQQAHEQLGVMTPAVRDKLARALSGESPEEMHPAVTIKSKTTYISQADAPACPDCGQIMVRNGSCYRCHNCGSTSGCS